MYFFDSGNPLNEKYEFYDYGHAKAILEREFPQEWNEIVNCLRNFELTVSDIMEAGGNESPIPKKIDNELYPYNWREIRISGDLHIKQYVRQTRQRRVNLEGLPYEESVLKGWIDGHNVDFIKGKVALDLEWNSKDQTFDRDINAMRAYFDYGIIDVGIILTRAENLNEVFSDLGIKQKYGASTTWIGKLTYRLDARRQGGCPILAIGITKNCVVDWRK